MGSPPRDRLEFIVRFTCAFVFFGFLAALFSLRIIDGYGLFAGSLAWLAVTTVISICAARFGDVVWEKLIHILSRW